MINDNLKKIREELGLTMTKFSEKLEIPAMTLIHYERGDRTPSAQLFIQLNKKLNINLNWLVSGKGKMFNSTNSVIEQSNEELENTIYKIMLRILKNHKIIDE